MTAPAPASFPPPAPQRSRVPAAPLPPRPGVDRAWRTVLVVVAALAVAVFVGGLGISSWLSAARWASYSDIPAATSLGRPSVLVVQADVGDVTVVTSDDAQEVSLALVDPETGLAEGTARASVTVSGGARGTDGTRVTVGQPGSRGILLGAEPTRDLMLTVPSDLAPALDLTVETDLGDVDVSGSEAVPWGSLSAHADLGDVTLRSVAATGPLEATSDLGDVTIGLVPGAAPASITAMSGTGDIHVQVPGTATYLVQATSDVGAVDVDPSIDVAHGDVLTAHADVGDVTVGR